VPTVSRVTHPLMSSRYSHGITSVTQSVRRFLCALVWEWRAGRHRAPPVREGGVSVDRPEWRSSAAASLL